jgi:hypothetical protein
MMIKTNGCWLAVAVTVVLVFGTAWRAADQTDKLTGLPLHPGLTFQQEIDAALCGHKAQMNAYDAPGTTYGPYGPANASAPRATLAEYVSWYRSHVKDAHYVHQFWDNRAQETFYSADGLSGVSITGSPSDDGVFAVTYVKMSAPLTTKQMDAFAPSNPTCK